MGLPADDDPTVRDGPGSVRPTTHADPGFERGTTIGRYVVLDVLGRGGMGVVYAAYDPELDRKVAIKLLQGRRDTDQAYLLREAHALARLSHPNVVAVHDVGSLPNDRVFIAMEYVHGDTLRRWLANEPRTWREVLPILRAAGHGLAAAHAAGLIHRDFKPDNVLVGHDGRVRVMDFGLARTHDELLLPSRTLPPVDVSTPFTKQLTLEGMVVGTPDYMAPELHAAKPAGPASDQFAFGVTLFEALYGERPFNAFDLVPPLPKPPRPRPPANSGVPARIERATLRALSLDPADRFPSMTALLSALSHDRRGRAIASTLAGAVVATVATVAILRATGDDAHAADVCGGGEDQIARVWNATTRQQLASGLARHRSAAPLVEVQHQLDRYATDWIATRRQVCEATRVRHEQSDTAFDLRMRCLGTRLESMNRLADLLAHADAATASGAAVAVRSLPRAEDCLTTTITLPPNPLQANQIDSLVEDRAEISALIAAGQYQLASTRAEALLPKLKTIGYDPVIGDLLLVMAVAQQGTARPAVAEQTLREAVPIAARAKDDRLLAEIWTTLIGVIGRQPARYTDALALEPVAEAAIARAEVGPGVRGDLAYNLATMHERKGEFAKASKAFAAAIELRREAFGPDDIDTGKLYIGLGSAQIRTGDLFAAKEAFEKALALTERHFGPSHPDMALVLNGLAAIADGWGDFRRALELHKRALRLLDEVSGPQHELVAITLYNVGVDYNGLEDYRAAIPYYEHAIAMLGDGHPYLGLALVGLADCREEVGDAVRAVDEAERGMRLIEAAASSDPFQLAVARYALGKALWSSNRDRARARTLIQQANDTFQTGGLLTLNAVAQTQKWLAKMTAR